MFIGPKTSFFKTGGIPINHIIKKIMAMTSSFRDRHNNSVGIGWQLRLSQLNFQCQTDDKVFPQEMSRLLLAKFKENLKYWILIGQLS